MPSTKVRSEQTSKRVSEIAGRVLAADIEPRPYAVFMTKRTNKSGLSCLFHITGAELLALAASCLTQSPDIDLDAPIPYKLTAKGMRATTDHPRRRKAGK